MQYEAEAGDFDLALTGDVMLTRRISMCREEAFVGLRRILTDADATFANLETTVRHADEGAPGITVGTYTAMPPELLDEIKWLGIGLVSSANNHAFDYGEAGVLATGRHLAAARIAHAGSGANLATARAPGYLDTARGRVGLVATTATFRPWNRAGAQRKDMGGRPGINPCGASTSYVVDQAALGELKRIGRALGFDKARARDKKHFYSDRDIGGGAAEDVTIAGQRFVVGEGFAVHAEIDGRDLDGNMRALAEARRQADWVVASYHTHEAGGRAMLAAENKADLDEPSEPARSFARAAVASGADVVVAHGSHTALGIEIIDGKPVFYGLGNLVFMNETVPVFPADAYERFELPAEATPADFLDARTDKDRKGHPANRKYWESVVAVCSWRGRRLSEVRLHPIELGFGRARAQRGRPMLASPPEAATILERIETMSKPFGTRIARDGDAGVIRV